MCVRSQRRRLILILPTLQNENSIAETTAQGLPNVGDLLGLAIKIDETSDQSDGSLDQK